MRETSAAKKTIITWSSLMNVLERSKVRISPIIWWKKIQFGKIALFITSLLLFILAITLMKEGAHSIAPLLQTTFSVDNPANSLGFGWFFAYLIMSGSPIAAASLTFFDAGAIDKLGAFAMINGSRLGASFIVLFIGFIYVLRGRDRSTSLSMGLLSLAVTITTHAPAFFLGAIILQMGWLDMMQLQTGMLLHSFLDLAIEPLATLLTTLLPSWLVFFIGLGITWLSFSLFDKCIPQITIKESQIGWTSHLVYRPVIMFMLGALITMISMSVSLSLSILVPLSTRGFVRRESVIPYIMGANITTFIDTLLAAVLLRNHPAFTIVLVEMLSIAVISLLILVIMYQKYRWMMLEFVRWVTANNRNLIIFMVVLFTLPLILMLM